MRSLDCKNACMFLENKKIPYSPSALWIVQMMIVCIQTRYTYLVLLQRSSSMSWLTDLLYRTN